MALKFKNGKEMYDYICEGNDIYSKTAEVYVFVYNDGNALCTYDLHEEDVAEILEKMKKNPNEEYWSAFLGWKGSNILDDLDYNDEEYRYSEDWEKNKLYLRPSLEFCENAYDIEDWVDCKDVEVRI